MTRRIKRILGDGNKRGAIASAIADTLKRELRTIGIGASGVLMKSREGGASASALALQPTFQTGKSAISSLHSSSCFPGGTFRMYALVPG